MPRNARQLSRTGIYTIHLYYVTVEPFPYYSLLLLVYEITSDIVCQKISRGYPKWITSCSLPLMKLATNVLPENNHGNKQV